MGDEEDFPEPAGTVLWSIIANDTASQ